MPWSVRKWEESAELRGAVPGCRGARRTAALGPSRRACARWMGWMGCLMGTSAALRTTARAPKRPITPRRRMSGAALYLGCPLTRASRARELLRWLEFATGAVAGCRGQKLCCRAANLRSDGRRAATRGPRSRQSSEPGSRGRGKRAASSAQRAGCARDLLKTCGLHPSPAPFRLMRRRARVETLQRAASSATSNAAALSSHAAPA